MEKPEKEGSVSSFQALMVSTASRVGTGNIVGVANAIILGGAGSVFWMWVVAIIGGASAFVESTLAQIYKKRDEAGNSYGGPAYYIESALKTKFLAKIFAVALILTYAIGFNMLAAFNLQTSFTVYKSFYDPNTTPMVIGGIVALLTAYCILGGGKRIIAFTSVLVPIMGFAYVLVAIAMMIIHAGLLPSVFGEIFKGAFDFKAIFGGLTGSALAYGIKRGLYSNEAGIGSAPNAAAAADVSHPVKQGLVQMLSVFIDTILICSATAFMILASGVHPGEGMEGAAVIQGALNPVLGVFGNYFITFSLAIFAFTTLIGNLFYVDNNLAYLFGKTPSKAFMTVFRIFASLVIFFGALQGQEAAWNIADLLMGLMALINLPAILILGSTAIKALRDYLAQKKAGRNPVFRASSIGLDSSKLDYWQ